MKSIEEITKRLELEKERLVDIESNDNVFDYDDMWSNRMDWTEGDKLIYILEWVLRDHE